MSMIGVGIPAPNDDVKMLCRVKMLAVLVFRYTHDSIEYGITVNRNSTVLFLPRVPF